MFRLLIMFMFVIVLIVYFFSLFKKRPKLQVVAEELRDELTRLDEEAELTEEVMETKRKIERTQLRINKIKFPKTKGNQ